MIDYTLLYLDTYIPESPKHINNNFAAVQRYLDIFYDSCTGLIIAPISTTGPVTGLQANFVNGVFDNLIVKKQFTNLFENTTTIDADFYNEYIGAPVGTRDASTEGAQIENGDFVYYDLEQPYIKIYNDTSIAFSSEQLGQEFQLIWDVSTFSPTLPFTILMDPSIGNGTVQILTIDVADSSTTWIKLIGIDYDASWGMAYTIKQYGGTYTLSNY